MKITSLVFAAALLGISLACTAAEPTFPVTSPVRSGALIGTGSTDSTAVDTTKTRP